MQQTLKKLEAAREFIEMNLDEDVDLESLARVACMSKYHFHRMFSAQYGISVAAYMRLLRLKKASYRLVYRPEVTITEIAHDCLYENSESFTRAFRKAFDVTPSDFRQQPDWTSWESHYDAIVRARNEVLQHDKHFDVEMVSFPNVTIATIEHRDVPSQLGSSVKALIEWRRENHLSPSRFRTFNLVYDDPDEVNDVAFRFDIGCEFTPTTDISDPRIKVKTIEGGRCAKIRFYGSSDAIGVAVRYLYSPWLALSGQKLRDYPVFFERINLFPDVPEHEMITDIYLPIQ